MAQNNLAQDSPAGNACPVPFNFQNHPIRTVMVDNQPWFVARDVSKALGLVWCGRTLSQVPTDWATMCKLHVDGRLRQVKVIAEPAVYKLAFRSNKPEADAFTNWVASEVLPAIRKAGQYKAPAKAPKGNRKPLVNLVSVWVGQSGISYSTAWVQIHAHFGVDSVEELNSIQVAEACAWVQQRIDAVPLSLPEPRAPETEELVRVVERRIREADRAAEDLFHAIGHGPGSRVIARCHTFGALYDVKEELFNSISNSMMAVRRLAKAVRLAEKELAHR